MPANTLKKLLRALGPLVGLAFVWTLFALMVGQPFMSWDNHRLMLLQTAVVGTAAIGATMIIIVGGIDLSVGSSIALGTMVIAKLLAAGAPAWVAALGGIASGAVCGLMIGSLVVGNIPRFIAIVAALSVAVISWRLVAAGSIPMVGGIGLALAAVALIGASEFISLRTKPLSPFIVTLGMWGALRGLAKGIGDNQPIYAESPPWLTSLMSRPIIPWPWRSATTDAVTAPPPGIAQRLWEMPSGVWIMLLVALAVSIVLNFTPFGRRVFAIGSNEHAARICGVRVERTKLLVYVLALACAGLAAVLQFSYLTIGDPTTASGYELKVIAAVVIGGASLSGGEGSVRGTLIGALLMTVLDNGCNKLQLDNWTQEVVTGAIIVVAVLIDRLRHRAV